MKSIFGATNVNGVFALSEVCSHISKWMGESVIVQSVFGNIIIDYDASDVDLERLDSEFYDPLERNGIDLNVLSAYLHLGVSLGGNALFAFSKWGGIQFGDPSDVRLSGIFVDGVECIVHVFDGVNLEVYSVCGDQINDLLKSNDWVPEPFPGMLGTYIYE